jgi:hypothetical protein
MVRRCNLLVLAAMTGALAPALVLAGVPRGLILAADEQVADEGTGTIIARGHAELSVEKYAIRGRADTIEVRPAIDEVLLKGSATVSVGGKQYRSETLSCTLNFARCVAVDANQPLPASALGSVEMEPR